MLQSVYGIFDTKAQRYLQPFFSENDATATRAVVQVLGDPQHQFSKFAEDYVLFALGVWDDEQGLLSPLAGGPKHVIGVWLLKGAMNDAR